MKPPDRHILRYLQKIDRIENNGQAFYALPKPGIERDCYAHAMLMGYFVTFKGEEARNRVDSDGTLITEVTIRGVSRRGFRYMDRIRWIWWSRAQAITIFIAALASLLNLALLLRVPSQHLPTAPCLVEKSYCNYPNSGAPQIQQDQPLSTCQKASLPKSDLLEASVRNECYPKSLLAFPSD